MKYNYQKIKVDYFNDPCMPIKVYWEENIGKWNGTIAVATTGWAKQKIEFNRKIAEERLKRIAEDKANYIDRALNIAIDVAIDALEEIARTPGGGIKYHKAAKNHWQIIRTEGGMPTNITHNTNDNSNSERDLQALTSLRDKLGKNKETSESQQTTPKGSNTKSGRNRKPTRRNSKK